MASSSWLLVWIQRPMPNPRGGRKALGAELNSPSGSECRSQWDLSELLDRRHLRFHCGTVGGVAAVVEDVLRRRLDVGLGLDHHRAAPRGQNHRRVRASSFYLPHRR